MKQENVSYDHTANFFFIVMLFLFILLQVAFHPTYLQYAPQFDGFGWIHHTHGAIMVCWMIMLVIQPYLIHKGEYKTHRLIGKISYVIAPLMLISMFLVTRLNYVNTVDEIPFREVAYIQALNFITPLLFFLFYSLAIIHKKEVFKHKRYMIGTAFAVVTAILSRFLYLVFGSSIEPYDFFISLYLGIIVAMLLLLNDILKNVNPIPYAIISVALIINIFIFHARYTEEWQSIVLFIGDRFF
ncbi:MAG: hypothetical protein EA341_01065 [Mongoliibacter sp.]|uniref:hypothetical protein n=1 Tax=Mongoliibacter sp. TaxID=2022438 RepID=UPI0012F2A5DB|nr:hypothetical protein [Mongoliibacter sp.]TVP53395.1 MAG: hypothetical protein EA341_01065 [Mongoliibacter sp.]